MTFNPAALAAGLQQAFSSVGNAMMQKEAERLAYQRALDKYQYQLQHKYDNPIDRALAEAQLAQLRRAGSGGGGGGSSGRLPNGLTPYQDATFKLNMLKLQEMINQNKAANELARERAYEQSIPYSDIAASLPPVEGEGAAQTALQGILSGYGVKDPATMAESLTPVMYNSESNWNPASWIMPSFQSFRPNPAASGKIIIKPGIPRPAAKPGKTHK